jgi:hypothetical protein
MIKFKTAHIELLINVGGGKKDQLAHLSTSACNLVVASIKRDPPQQQKQKRRSALFTTTPSAASREFTLTASHRHSSSSVCARTPPEYIVALCYFQCLEARDGRYQQLRAAGRLEWLLLHSHPRFATGNLLELVSCLKLPKKTIP